MEPVSPSSIINATFLRVSTRCCKIALATFLNIMIRVGTHYRTCCSPGSFLPTYARACSPCRAKARHGWHGMAWFGMVCLRLIIRCIQLKAVTSKNF